MTKAESDWYRRQPERPAVGSRLADFGYCYFQGGRYVVEMDRDGAIVYRASGWGGGWEWVVHVEATPAEIMCSLEGSIVASRWIKKAVATRAKKSPTALGMDESLGKGRPALTEFMTELEAAPGEPREVSALMVTMSENGVRAGLKDEDAGGWCWREGKTLQDALDGIEKALQAGEGAFRAPRSNKAKRR